MIWSSIELSYAHALSSGISTIVSHKDVNLDTFVDVYQDTMHVRSSRLQDTRFTRVRPTTSAAVHSQPYSSQPEQEERGTAKCEKKSLMEGFS